MRIARLTIAVVLALAMVSCGDDDDDATGGADTTSAPSTSVQTGGAGTFTGTVEGTDAYIAVVASTDGGEAVAYVCDGTAEGEATVAAFLEGTLADGTLDLEPADGVEVEGAVDGEATGTVTIDGEEHAFTAAAVELPAGLWFAEGEDDDGELTARWIVLADGTQRGSLRRSTGTVNTAPFIEQDSGFVNLTSSVSVSLQVVNPLMDGSVRAVEPGPF